MKVDKFAVSVQYGRGHHFWLRTDYLDVNKASSAAAVKRQRRMRLWKRGFKPTVYVWELKERFNPQLPATQKPVKQQPS